MLVRRASTTGTPDAASIGAGAAAMPDPGAWTPTDVTAVPSSRGPRLRGVVDAIRGVGEAADGQRLSQPMVDALTGHLAESFQLPSDVVREDLAATSLYVGGPGGFGNSSGIAIGRDVYVPDKRTLDRILSWDGRGFLAHELGHVMQWRRDHAGMDGEVPEALATRRYLLNYAARSLVEGWSPGAVPRGLWRWVASRVPGSNRPDRSLSAEMHDAHAMEAETDAQAKRFRAMTSRIE